MDNTLHKTISKDKQIKKFSFYGFLKDLKFFEPYLLIFLLGQNISLFQIGILMSIREIIINVFEIPSGFLADYFGRKKELCMCFIAYIISFVFFFFTHTFLIACFGMIFFGLGEALRSGTHKAMIYTYLEKQGWEKEKTFVYGKTRSFSLVGSAVSSLLAIILILNVPHSGYIFLVSTIPYIIDFILILTYPAYLDKGDAKEKITFRQMLVLLKNSFVKSPSLRHIILEEGFFESVISCIKDFIQPILKSIIIGTGIIIVAGVSQKSNLSIVLGIVYALINLMGSLASRKSYILKRKKSAVFLLNTFQILLSVTLALIGIFIKHAVIVCILYLVIYVLQNFRKPVFIDKIDDYMAKSERATILSIASQMKSICVVVLAPVSGFVADKFGIHFVMYFLAALLIVGIPLTRLKENSKVNIEIN